MDTKGKIILRWGIGAAVAAFVASVMLLGLARWGLIPATAVAMGTLGVFLGYLALVHDPLNGLSRCPRCAYEIDEASVRGMKEPGSLGCRCPECGEVITDPEALVRTPKRWGLAAAAGMMVVFAAAGPFVRQAANEGMWRPVPTWAIVAMLPVASEEGWEELEVRLNRPQAAQSLRAWEHRLLASRCAATVESTRAVTVRLAALDILLRIEPNSNSAVRAFRVATRDPEPYMADWAMKHAFGPWLGRELAMVIDDPSIAADRRADAIWTARFWKIRDPKLLEAILRAIADPSPTVRDAAGETLEVLQQAWVNPSIRPLRGGGLGFSGASIRLPRMTGELSGAMGL